MSTATIEKPETIEHLDFAILCESGLCEDYGRGIHSADWFWYVECPCGTLTVCEDRRWEFLYDAHAFCYEHKVDITPNNSQFIKIDQ